jgi:hypothetical protein
VPQPSRDLILQLLGCPASHAKSQGEVRGECHASLQQSGRLGSTSSGYLYPCRLFKYCYHKVLRKAAQLNSPGSSLSSLMPHAYACRLTQVACMGGDQEANGPTCTSCTASGSPPV